MITPGQQIAQFKILRQIGAGGMGEVFLATDTKLGRQVALKVLPAEMNEDPDRIARFQREASAAARITHPNVAAIYNIEKHTDENTGTTFQYIVMEYVEGVSLKEHLVTKKSDIADVLRMAEKIAAGLSAAHKLNIVHRDIKAENIIVNLDGDPKILDFGLAKILSEEAQTALSQPSSPDDDTISKELTEIGKIVGTVTYMSPEQARGERLDTRSDIFSFGALLYRMCTGEFPFSGPTQVSTIAKILETAHAAPSGKNSAIPPELERIINKCLQKSADDRYQDTRDLVVDLRDLRKKYDSDISDSISGIHATSGTGSTASKPPKKLSPGQIAILAVSGIMSIFFVTTAWLQDDDSTNFRFSSAAVSEYSIAILDFENMSNDADLDWLEDGFPDILLTDLTETGALSVLSRGRIFDWFRREGISGENTDGTYSRQQMREACKTLGASSIISGSFFKIGDKIRIDARMEHVADGKTLWSQKVVGDDLFALVDSLTDKVAVALDITDIMPSRGAVSTVMTFSPEAYRHYHEGMESFSSNLFEEARESFRKALAIDSTFALPNMRMGMTYVFSGKQTEAAKYFQKAKAFQNKLPIRDRNLVDIYLDVFLTQNFAIGFAKMETYVANYPDDKEARTIYGLFQNVGNDDTAAAFEQFRIVLDQDPGFQFALSQSIDLLQQGDRFEEAIETIKQLLRYHPESPEPYRELIDSYDALGNTSQAIEAAHTMLKKFPDHAQPLQELSQLFVKQRTFDSSRFYLELYSQDDTTDYSKWATYHYLRASLAIWEGKFLEATKHFHNRLQASIQSEDDNLIEVSYRILASHFHRLEMQDSMVFYAKATTRQTSTAFQEVSYPLMMISLAYDEGTKLRLHFDSLEAVIRGQLPTGMWVIVESLKDIYYGFYELDTARAIRGFQALNSDARFRSSENIIQTGSLQIDVGLFSDALESLLPLLSGKMEQTNGYSALLLRYLIGTAYEGLGNSKKAIEFYQEVLRYWGKPDIEIKQIRDTRKRLARLTS